MEILQVMCESIQMGQDIDGEAEIIMDDSLSSDGTSPSVILKMMKTSIIYPY